MRLGRKIKELGPGLLDEPAAGRSNTRPSIEGHSNGGQVAQLVEQRTENPRVVGSIPTLATTSRRSVLDTSVTFYTDDMGNTLAANGLSAHSKRVVS
jgi:hypothetical protein